jgi:heme oxygenase
MAVAMQAHAQLRLATAADHDAVDAAFGAFDLTRREDYVAFLRAHGRAVPAVEQALRDGPLPLTLRGREPLLAADLAALGSAMPVPLPLRAPADAAEAFGMAYVIEGSRLGGSMIARALPPTFPNAYLSARHENGEWRRLLGRIEEASGGDPAWIAAATAAARRTFALYAAAAAAAD